MINRLELIDHTECDDCDEVHGRIVVVSPEEGKSIEASIQDGGRTLKIFITRPE